MTYIKPKTSKITKILISEENSKQKVPNKIGKSNAQAYQNEWITTDLEHAIFRKGELNVVQ